MKTRILMVLRSGGDFAARDVRALVRGIRAHSSRAILTLYTDCEQLQGVEVDEVKPLETAWPGWWAKIEMFREPGPVLYMDLDSVVVGDLTPMLHLVETLRGDELLIAHDLNPRCNRYQSTIMGWSGNLSAITEHFASLEPTFRQMEDGWYATTPFGLYRGDQDYIPRALMQLSLAPRTLQDEAAGAGVYSYKLDIRKRFGGVLPDDAVIVCFHGKPRPREVAEVVPWMHAGAV